MKKVLFGVLTLGAAALVSASAVAVNRSIPATAISTYQDFNCFEKDAGDIRLKSSTGCRNKSLYTWLPVPVDPNSGAVLASVRRFKEGGSGCYDQDACIAAYTLDKDGDVYFWSGWQCGSSGYDNVHVGNTTMSPDDEGSAGIAFRTYGQSGCTISYGTVKYTY